MLHGKIRNVDCSDSPVQGVDPDAPEDEDENEADDVDGDQDDAELL